MLQHVRTQGIWFPLLLPEETTRGKTSTDNIINGDTMAKGWSWTRIHLPR